MDRSSGIGSGGGGGWQTSNGGSMAPFRHRFSVPGQRPPRTGEPMVSTPEVTPTPRALRVSPSEYANQNQQNMGGWMNAYQQNPPGAQAPGQTIQDYWRQWLAANQYGGAPATPAPPADQQVETPEFASRRWWNQ